MLIAWIFEPAFTGLGIVLACVAVAAAAILASGDHESDSYRAELTLRWRRRR